MQVLVQVYCTNGPSLRERIANDARIEKRFGLRIEKEHHPGRSPGWLKIHSARDKPGAVNVEWYGRANVLTARVVTRGRAGPSSIIGDFIEYLLARHRSRIRHISIVP